MGSRKGEELFVRLARAARAVEDERALRVDKQEHPLPCGNLGVESIGVRPTCCMAGSFLGVLTLGAFTRLVCPVCGVAKVAPAEAHIAPP